MDKKLYTPSLTKQTWPVRDMIYQCTWIESGQWISVNL